MDPACADDIAVARAGGTRLRGPLRPGSDQDDRPGRDPDVGPRLRTVEGALMWQDGDGSNPDAPVELTGNGALNLAGTIYAPDAHVKITGNGDAVGTRLAVQIISWTLGRRRQRQPLHAVRPEPALPHHPARAWSTRARRALLRQAQRERGGLARILRAVDARAAEPLIGLDAPRAERHDVAAHAQREADLGERAVASADGDHGVGRGDDHEVADHAEAGRDRRADELVRLGRIGPREDADRLAAGAGAPREAARMTPPRPPVTTVAPPRASCWPTSSAHSRIRWASGPRGSPSPMTATYRGRTRAGRSVTCSSQRDRRQRLIPRRAGAEVAAHQLDGLDRQRHSGADAEAWSIQPRRSTGRRRARASVMCARNGSSDGSRAAAARAPARVASGAVRIGDAVPQHPRAARPRRTPPGGRSRPPSERWAAATVANRVGDRGTRPADRRCRGRRGSGASRPDPPSAARRREADRRQSATEADSAARMASSSGTATKQRQRSVIGRRAGRRRSAAARRAT